MAEAVFIAVLVVSSVLSSAYAKSTSTHACMIFALLFRLTNHNNQQELMLAHGVFDAI